MATPGKQTSRWGSFLQQAVAGVESRLDNILAEGEDAPVPAKKPPTPSATPKAEASVSRTASTNKTNDRLAERLARAVAAKNNAQKVDKADSLALSSGVPSRTGSPATVADSPRQSIDAERPSVVEVGRASLDVRPTEESAKERPSIEVQPPVTNTTKAEEPQEPINGLSAKPRIEGSPRPSMDSARPSLSLDSIDSIRHPVSVPESSIDLQGGGLVSTISEQKSADEKDAAFRLLQSDFETSELQRQEEVHSYIERIDALQSKLQYLAKESAEAAKQAGNSAPAGSSEKKLAGKDEQIALLMEEGQKLSKKELNQMTIIKKLRAKIQEDGKELTEARLKQEKAETDASLATDRLRRDQGWEKQIGEKHKQVLQLQKDLDAIKTDTDAKDATIADLKRQLEDVATHEKEAEAKAVHAALEAERKRVLELEDDLANLRVEKNLATERGQNQLRELREKMDKDAERARMAELEAKTEQQMLESKLEVMRARAEEVTSGTGGDTQAKLLRQIETLQSHYAIANENWQGIEASLVARATSLEKERDEASRREADIRKKAREVTLKAKRNEDELEEARSRMPTFQQELAEHKSNLDALQQKAEDAESALVTAKASFAQERQAWQAELLQRVEEERQKWQDESGSLGHNGSRAQSPIASMRRGLTTEYLGLQNLQLRRASARSINSDVPHPERLLVRRPSASPIGKSSGNATPVRQNSAQSFTREHNYGPDAPSIHTDNDDFFENNASLASPRDTLHDMVSVSTAGAGPSVQLVERMSSAVRRLESEKVATKEDLARLSAQRDEARGEIVSLMRELQSKRDQDTRITELENELKDINSRYQTTLEMLGEKSELVDELKSDIDDIKAMYRELVERTVK